MLTLYGVQPPYHCDVTIVLCTLSWSEFILWKSSVLISCKVLILFNIHHLQDSEKLHLQPTLLQQTNVLFDMQDED